MTTYVREQEAANVAVNRKKRMNKFPSNKKDKLTLCKDGQDGKDVDLREHDCDDRDKRRCIISKEGQEMQETSLRKERKVEEKGKETRGANAGTMKNDD